MAGYVCIIWNSGWNRVCLSYLQLIMVDELRNDYRNPVDFCQNLNRVSA